MRATHTDQHEIRICNALSDLSVSGGLQSLRIIIDEHAGMHACTLSGYVFSGYIKCNHMWQIWESHRLVAVVKENIEPEAECVNMIIPCRS